MKKYIIAVCVVFVLSLAFPSSAMAAWWNPFSWGLFKRDRVEISTSTIDIACTMDAKQCPDGSYVGRTPPTCEFAACPSVAKPTPRPATPATPEKPTITLPIVPSKPSIATSTTAKPVTPTVKATSTATSSKPVEVPRVVLGQAFTPSGFVAPITVRTGTTLLSVGAVHGDSRALGLWYVDAVTWRVAPNGMRDGDFTVAIYSGNRIVEERSDVFSTSRRTVISAHVASDSISFVINSRVPNRGSVQIIVDKVEGSMKGDTKQYEFIGTPIVGPEFKF